MTASTMSNNVGPGLVAGAWVAAGTATIILILRFVAKTRIHHVRADDLVMLLALVCDLLNSLASTFTEGVSLLGLSDYRDSIADGSRTLWLW